MQQHKAAQLQAQQQAALEPSGGGGDSDMTPADEPEPASTAAAMDVQQEGPAEQVEQATSSGRGAEQQLQQQVKGAERTGSLLSSSSGSLISLGGSSFPPVNITAGEFDRLGLLLEAARISKAELAVLLEQSSGSGSSSGGAAAGSSRSLFADLNLSAAGAKGAQAGASSSGSGSGDWLASRITSTKLSSFVPGFVAAGSVSMEECFSWLSSCWLHKMQQAVMQQHKAAAAAAAGGGSAAAAGANQPPGVSPLFQQPAFGSGSAGDAATGGSSALKQPISSRSGGVANMLGDLSAGGSNSSNVAAWLGMSSSPPNAAAQHLRTLGSPAGLNSAAATSGGGLGTFVGGLNGVPVVTSVTSGGPGPLTPVTAAGAAAAAGGASPAAGSSPAAAAAAGASPAAADAAATAAGSSPAAAAAGSGAGLAGLIGSGPAGLGSIKVSTTRGMVAVAGGSVDEHTVSGVYRGTVVRGPADVAGDSLTIQDCNEAHVYVLAPVK